MRLSGPTRPTCLATDWSTDGIGFFSDAEILSVSQKDS